MRTPTTVEVPKSAVGVGTTLRLVAENRRTGVRRVPLPVAFVALTTLDLRLGLFSTVGRERLADVIGLLELPSGAASHESIVSSGVDQLTLRGLFLPAVFFVFAFFAIVPLLSRGAISVPVDELDSR